MVKELTHASFFSGVGGLDLGLERAGWRTVSVSEIDPYANTVLAERWPGVPNLGSITALADDARGQAGRRQGAADLGGHEPDAGDGQRSGVVPPWQRATLWSGGFPCQDLSIAGKRGGFAAGDRSVLAFAFLDLVAVHRPPIVLLENVPGLLSSHDGRDMATLLGTLVELGYGVGYRVLDARYFGVPQRRRRVFIVGVTPGGRAGAERAAEVLSVGSRCRRHPPAGVKAREEPAIGVGGGSGIAGNLTRRYGKGVNTTLDDGAVVYGSSPDPDGVRTPDGLAGRVDDRGRVEPQTFVKRHRAASVDDAEGWADEDTAPTLNDSDTGDARAVALAVGGQPDAAGDGLPLGLDSHRYRCCGNGVVSSVTEWIGLRLAALA